MYVKEGSFEMDPDLIKKELEDIIIRDLINSSQSKLEPSDEPIAFSLDETRWLSGKEIMERQEDLNAKM